MGKDKATKNPDRHTQKNRGGKALLLKANIDIDAGVIEASDKDAFIAAAKTRQWDREKPVRILA